MWPVYSCCGVWSVLYVWGAVMCIDVASVFLLWCVVSVVCVGSCDAEVLEHWLQCADFNNFLTPLDVYIMKI